jgi:hypothetical protein
MNVFFLSGISFHSFIHPVFIGSVQERSVNRNPKFTKAGKLHDCRIVELSSTRRIEHNSAHRAEIGRASAVGTPFAQNSLRRSQALP